MSLICVGSTVSIRRINLAALVSLMSVFYYGLMMLPVYTLRTNTAGHHVYPPQ